MATITTKFDQAAIAKAQSVLAQLPIELREKALVKAIRKASRLVTKAVAAKITPPGYPGDERGKPALSKSMTGAVRTGGNFVAGFVGAKWPDAAHLHLYEEGHEKWLWGQQQPGEVVRGKGDFSAAADETRQAQENAIISTLKAEIGKLGKR